MKRVIFPFLIVVCCINEPWAQEPGLFTQSNLPIVIINTNNAAIPDEPKILARMRIIYAGPGKSTSITDTATVYDGNIGTEQRGFFSKTLPQKPYGIETRDDKGQKMNVSLLGMPSEHDWILLANYNDRSFVRNTLAFKLFSEMGHYAPRSVFCEVILNGNYQGIYLLTEKIKRDKNRVDIAKLDRDDNAGDSLTGGYIIKNDRHVVSNSWKSNYHPNMNVNFVYEYRSADSLSPAQKKYIQSFIDSLGKALYSTNFADTASGYRKYMSVNSFIDYFIINELSRNPDGFRKSVFYHKDKDKVSGKMAKLKAGPVWDFDWAWKNIIGCPAFQATDGSSWSHRVNDCSPDVASNGWYLRLLQDPKFAKAVKTRWFDLRKTILDTAYIFNYVDSVALVLDASQKRHFTLWSNLGLNSGAPEAGPISATFPEEIQALKGWIRKRITWLDANISGMR